MASHPIYQFYAELEGFKPKIWRRFQVQNNITVARLAYIVMTLFEMRASHLFAVEVPKGKNYCAYMKKNSPEVPKDKYPTAFTNIEWRYEIIDENIMEFGLDREVEIKEICKATGKSYEEVSKHMRPIVKHIDATEAYIKDAVSHVGEKISVNYDFGDDWWVDLKLEKIFEDKELDVKLLPQVIKGEGFGIVEDSGGIWGLDDLAKAFKSKKGKKYKELCEWLDKEDFDITTFDIDDMNFRLKKIPAIYAKIYEHKSYPTQASINLIERKYLEKPKRKRNWVWVGPENKN